MNILNRFLHISILLLLASVFACSSEKGVDNYGGRSQENGMAPEGNYVYIFVAKLSGSREELSQLKNEIDTMLGKIPDIIDMVSGIEYSEKTSYNYGVTIRFKDKAARDAYSSNPHHVALGEQYSGSSIIVETATVEYEVK